jgi:hypothetical protein
MHSVMEAWKSIRLCTREGANLLPLTFNFARI